MAVLVLTVAYEGMAFAGSQVQPGVRTVQEEIETALAGLMGYAERCVFAGRTDSGVHAAGQVVGCRDGRPTMAPANIRAALNARLPTDVAVTDVRREADGFHARHDARWREYRYRVWSGGRQPLAQRQVWQRTGPLDPAAMDEAAGRLIGERDFASLAGAGDGVPWSERRDQGRGTVRRVLLCRCRELVPWWGTAEGTLVEIRVVADAFLPHMVRNLTSLLVEASRGERGADWIDRVLDRRDRRAAPATAPAHGLTLWRVGYGNDRPLARDLASSTTTL